MTGCLTTLGRLGRDNAGNTLAIAAASLLPLMALIGGGVDISRSYMAKTELQSACDAGVLAGRKAMSKTGSYGTAEKAKADKMFDFNFKGASLNVTNLSYETDDNDEGQVLGTATATVPTLVMQIFDKDKVDLSVNCMAELQIGNADIMFVLDTTGSMLCTPEDTKSNCTQLSATATNTRIAGLRDAVKDFHKTVNQAVTDDRTRIRYGFVPYSMTVNVGGLVTSGAMPTSYLSNTVDLPQARRAYFNTPVYVAEPTSTTNDTEWYVNSNNVKQLISSSNCTKYGTNDYPSDKANPVTTGTAPNDVVKITYSYGGRGSESGTNKSCYRKRKVETTEYNVEYKFTSWSYTDDAINTSLFKTKAAVTIANPDSTFTEYRVKNRGYYTMEELPTAEGVSTITKKTMTWSGCIEERDTVDEDDFDPIPDGALDLDFDLEPDANDRDTQWRPMVPDLYYTYRKDYASGNNGTDKWLATSFENSKTSPIWYCPSEMMLFKKVELDKTKPDAIPGWLNTYVNNLRAEGSTYHDIGMIWGGRLTSATGIFADNVNEEAETTNVSRHIIFMTDGMMQPSETSYSAYGIEDFDHRIGGSDVTALTARHNARFKAMCKAIKEQGTTIWVVAFGGGSTVTSTLQECASEGRAYKSGNTAALKNTFKYIASQVADLRLGA